MTKSAATIQPITAGPKHHWFGYYDKRQFDPSSRYALGMEVDFESRQPDANDEITLGIIDLEDKNRWREIGCSRAWCWQQGCMLQWIPGSDRKIIWNDRDRDRFVARVLDVETGALRTIPAPIYSIAPDGKTAIGTDFRRINHMRPGYGYAGIADPNQAILAPDDTGIYKVDLDASNSAGTDKLLISIAQIAAIPYPHVDLSSAKHYFNHLLFNTDGSRFIFLHRWRIGDSGIQTRMMTAAADGSDLHVVDDYGKMSHFIWRDPQTILGWSWQPSDELSYYIYEDKTANVRAIAKDKMMLNGHCTYLRNTDWILNDCYPQGEDRLQSLYLYNVSTDRRIDLGSLVVAKEWYRDELRCDLHPRSDPSGGYVTIDSTHGGDGRQIYLLDIRHLVDKTQEI